MVCMPANTIWLSKPVHLRHENSSKAVFWLCFKKLQKICAATPYSYMNTEIEKSPWNMTWELQSILIQCHAAKVFYCIGLEFIDKFI